MSFTVVARKDFADARRSRALWFLTALFVLFAGVMAYAYATLDIPITVGTETYEGSTLGLVFFLVAPASLFISITAVVIANKAIAGERESGQMKLALGLPNSRFDFVLGKVVGRAAVLLAAVVIGFVVSLGVVVATLGELALVPFATFLGVTVVYALVYVSLVVALSSMFASAGQATSAAVGLWFLLEVLWDVVPLGLYWVVNGFSLDGQPPQWIGGIAGLSPSTAYNTALTAVMPNVSPIAQGDAFYLQPWFGLVVLAFWLVVPLALGAWRFNSVDL
ncbi:ABC transporter permease [Haloarchaeobius sp. HME9146]|uniref:ABC transporter permease n=1 Tax=Haloarchaeobius sp. HME9146 TaxID=2978732 RepID=UPI0021C07301|nr:ABC transporter permease [Haloarchaeobius sp. HME9146]MCT9094899.1 ABC transporter permease [Haloarchaeobius sp. HME9146]